MSMTLLGLTISGNFFPVAAATWNVVDFGARGDAIQTLATTVNNSTQVILAATNRLSAADAGKLIELFGVGPVTSGTNHQDVIAIVVSVSGGTNVVISVPAGRTASDVPCTIGTGNATAFQNCVNACQNTNDTVWIPAGCYLLVPPQILDARFVMASASTLCLAVSVSRGGLRFLGDTPEDTILLGNGAWTLNNGSVQRGVLFGCAGPVANNEPLVFENLAFDGGVQTGNQHLGSGPASPVDGSGWDITHDAVVDLGQPPCPANQQFVNCHFAHWRGEMLKSVVSCDTGFIGVTNCEFSDGDGSGFNFNWTPHIINGCLFSNLDMAMEFYVGTMQAGSIFENCVVTNTRIGISLVGALTNHPSPGYAIVGNSISAAKYGILLGPARNVEITGNTFLGGVAGIATDSYAYQGTDINRDILVESNQFVNTASALAVCGNGPDRLVNMTWLTNTAWGCANFASGYGWSSNVVFIGNRSLQPALNGAGSLDSSRLEGQWFTDDASNEFPPNRVSFGVGQLTNFVSYSHGMRYEVHANDPSGVCPLDATQPGRIPPGAGLTISNAGASAVAVSFAGTTPQGGTSILSPGHIVTCIWSNQVWLPIPSGTKPPANLRVNYR